MNTITAEDIEQENFWIARLMDAAGVSDKAEFYLNYTGGGDYEAVVNHHHKVPMEIHYFRTQKEAQKHLIERYPDAKWEETGWND